MPRDQEPLPAAASCTAVDLWGRRTDLSFWYSLNYRSSSIFISAFILCHYWFPSLPCWWFHTWSLHGVYILVGQERQICEQIHKMLSVNDKNDISALCTSTSPVPCSHFYFCVGVSWAKEGPPFWKIFLQCYMGCNFLCSPSLSVAVVVVGFVTNYFCVRVWRVSRKCVTIPSLLFLVICPF